MADNFNLFARAVHERFNAMATSELFTVDAGDLFETYLSAYPDGTNPIFRERTEHDCSCCKHFVRNIGGVVSLVGNRVTTVWDGLPDLPHPYNVVAERMGEVVRQLPVNSVYRTRERRYGADRTIEPPKPGGTVVREWRHFHANVPDRNRTDDADQARGTFNTAAQVFQRGLSELSISALETVLDLIDSNSLYRGEEHRRAVDGFLTVKRAYEAASDKTLFAWANADTPAARFRNTAIGSLVVDLSNGVDVNDAVRMFESKVAPTNYRRSSAPITQNMIDNAVNTLRSLGLETAVERRMARLSDVSVNNVLFVDNSVRGSMRDGIAGLLSDAVKPHTPDLKHATPISIDDFMSSVVPTASSIDLLVQNRHAGNFVTLTAPVHEDSGRLFRWANDFAWSYDGDLADSVKQRVKRAGGNVDAAVRVSLAWSNYDDLDLHCREPNGNHVFYGNKSSILDVDMNAGCGTTREPVENLAWTQRSLRDGVYDIWVNQYQQRESHDIGFAIEIESTNGGLRQFTYNRKVAGDIECFKFFIQNGEVIDLSVNPSLTASNASRDIWSVQTETLVPVATLMNSPNHWDGIGVGQKHWLFMLKGCKNPNATRGIYNEFLTPELNEHRKVFEILGSRTKCQPTDDQLSGVGFTSARGDTVTAVVKGRAFNIQF